MANLAADHQSSQSMQPEIPKISVVIPLYNAESTIQATIESACNQSFQDVEIIVVNDGSTDNSPALVRAIADPRITVLDYENAGGSIARNRGIAAANSDLIALLDGDDLWHPDKLQVQFAALQSHPDVALVHSWTDYINETGQWICAGGRPIAGPDAYEKLLVANFLENGSTPLIRKSALAEVGGFDPTLKACQDTDLYLKIARKFSILTVPSVHVYYRMTSGSVSDRISDHEQQAISFIHQTFAAAPVEFQHLKQASLAHYYRYLTLRGLEGKLTPKRGLKIARLFYLAIVYNPKILSQETKLVTILWIKIALAFMPTWFTGIILSFTQRQRHQKQSWY